MGSVWYTSFYGCRPWAVGPTLFYSERRGEGKGGGGVLLADFEKNSSESSVPHSQVHTFQYSLFVQIH